MPATEKRGMLLLELALVVVILSLLSNLALPVYQITLRREKELRLMERLREIRRAIDSYHDAMAKKSVELPEEQRYPATLETLVQEKYLRRVPADPLTGEKSWRTISSTDPYDSRQTDGRNVFDVVTGSREKALDGTPYASW